MIYTLTTNPSIDYYLFSEKEMAEGINRIGDYQFVAAGKGVNVSRVLANLSEDNKCVIVSGGFTGAYICQKISELEHIEVINIPTAGDSRVNVKIRHAGKETDLNTSGPVLTEESKKQLISVFDEINENDFVCFNGSLQKGMKETMIEIAKRVNEKKGRLVLDVPNLSYSEILQCQPYLIKPNDDELRDLLECDDRFPELAYKAQRQLASKGINVMLSLGKKGSCYIGKDEIIKVKCPKVKAVNTVGAGDSLLAGLVYMLENSKPLEDCLRFASAVGSAAVTTVSLPTKEIIEPLIKEVEITKIG